MGRQEDGQQPPHTPGRLVLGIIEGGKSGATMPNLERVKVEPTRILRVLSETQRLIRMVRTSDKEKAWQLLEQSFLNLLGADQCAFVLVDAHTSSKLFLPLHKERQFDEESLLQHLNDAKDQTWSTAYESSGGGQAEAEFERQLLPESRYVLWNIIRSEEGLLGAILCSRDHSSDGGRDPFTPEDAHVARLLGESAAAVLDSLRALKLLRDLRKDVHQSLSRGNIFEATLKTALKLLRREAGRVVGRGPNGKLEVHCQHGPVLNPELTPGVYESLLRDDGDAGTLDSPLRVPIRWGESKTTYGVLELEAGFEAFNDNHLDMLRWVARHAASDCALVDKLLDLENWEAELAKISEPVEIAERLVQRLKDEVGCEAGVVYRSLPRTRSLYGFAGGTDQRNLREAAYVFRTCDTSAATYAFNEEPFATINPLGDGRVSQRGLQDFDVKGPLAAMPLVEADDAPFGSIAIWWSEAFSQAEADERLKQARMIVRHASRPLRLALYAQTSQAREKFQNEVAIVLQQMTYEDSLDANLRKIMEAIRQCGFTRVRLYRFKYGDTLVGLMSTGMADAAADFDNGKYSASIEANRYTKFVFDGVNNARRARIDAGEYDSASHDLLARIYPARDEEGNLIPDDHSEKLRKPEGMPWVDVPVMSGGKFYGLLAADKLQFDSPEPKWGDITDWDLDAIDMFAQLAGRAFSMDERRGMLIQSSVETLDKHTGVHEPLALVVRRLLLYLGHGDEGLRFSRALLLGRESEHHNYHLVDAVGSTNVAEFMGIVGNTHDWSLSKVLLHANSSHDESLRSAVRQRMNSADTQSPLLPDEVDAAIFRRDDQAVPQLIAALQSSDANTESGFRLDDCIVARISIGGKELGVVVVDRPAQWDQSALISSDQESLITFCRHAAQILHRYEAVLARLKDLESFARGVVHELRSPLGNLARHEPEVAELLQGLRPGVSDADARGDLERLIGMAEDMKGWRCDLSSTLKDLEQVFFPGDSQTLDAISTDEIMKMVEELHTEGECKIHVNPADTTHHKNLLAPRPDVRIALGNLIRNAQDALQKASRGESGRIDVAITCHVSRTEISVRDNGAGVTVGHLAELRRLSPNSVLMHSGEEPPSQASVAPPLQTRPHFGLFLVHWIAHKHNGTVRLDSVEGEGFTATIDFPNSSQ
ncbi:MAG: GAF domain-containing sensor histidine kinase [Planctomycetales bacterium]|nr:GAF domain-containing sensor histidine kinase [Planctomycetales bacterium]